MDETVVARAILNSAADAIVGSDREGFVRIWNPGAVRIFGYTEAEALGQSLGIIIPERLRKRHWDGYRKTMETGESRYGHGDLLSVPGLRHDGRQLSLEFTIIPLKDGVGTMIGMIAVMRDVSSRFAEMKKLKEQLAAGSKNAV